MDFSRRSFLKGAALSALGGAAAPVVAEAIKTANGVVGVDGVSGATMTSNAIKAAVNAALKQGK